MDAIEKFSVVRISEEGENNTEDAVTRDVLFKRFITSGCGRGVSFYSAADATGQKGESQVEISAHDVFTLVSDFQRRSQIYRMTGGIHSAVLCHTKGILVFSEDMGRHNSHWLRPRKEDEYLY